MANSVLQPIDLLLGVDNDIVISTDAALSSGLSGIAQGCRIAVQMFAEEWFLNLDVGIGYLQDILGRGAAVAILAARQQFTNELLAVNGVFSISKLDFDFDSSTRTLTVTWAVNTVLGVTPVDSIQLVSSGGTLT